MTTAGAFFFFFSLFFVNIHLGFEFHFFKSSTAFEKKHFFDSFPVVVLLVNFCKTMVILTGVPSIQTHLVKLSL